MNFGAPNIKDNAISIFAFTFCCTRLKPLKPPNSARSWALGSPYKIKLMFYFAGNHALGCSHGSCILEAFRDCIDCAMQLTNNFISCRKKERNDCFGSAGFVEFTTGGNPCEIIRTSQGSFHAPASDFFCHDGEHTLTSKKIQGIYKMVLPSEMFGPSCYCRFYKPTSLYGF